MKFNLQVRRTAWVALMVLLSSGLLLSLATVYNGYGAAGAVFGLLIILIMALPLAVALIPSAPTEVEKVVYRYADERAPEGFDTQA